MKRLPKVSIVIPVYNGSKYVKEAIDSALAQTYKNFEVIVVNDGSNDGGKTEKIARSYGKKIRYFKKKNGGVSSALNYGIKKMKGEWFSWLSHDDVYLPSKLSDQIKFALKNMAKFIYSRAFQIDEFGKLNLKKDSVSFDWKSGKKNQTRQLLESNKISGCTTLIHKVCFQKCGLFNENNKTAQDWEMWIRISLKFKLFRFPNIVMNRRKHPGMGSLLLARYNQEDKINTIRSLAENIEITEIYADRINTGSTEKDMASIYSDFGDLMAKYWDQYDLANLNFRKSYSLYPSLKNKAWLKLLIGTQRYYFPYLLKKKTLNFLDDKIKLYLIVNKIKNGLNGD